MPLARNLYGGTLSSWEVEPGAASVSLTSSQSAEAPSPGFAWSWLNGLCIGRLFEKKQQREAGPSVLEKTAREALCQLPLPHTLMVWPFL